MLQIFINWFKRFLAIENEAHSILKQMEDLPNKALALAERVNVEIKGVEDKIKDHALILEEKVKKATEVHDNAVSLLKEKNDTLSSTEYKMRLIAKNWAKHMLDQ